MEYTHIRYSDITTCIDSVRARAGELGDGWSPNELYEGEQSHAYIINAPNWNTIDSLWWNTLNIRYSELLRVWFCECQSSNNWRTDGLQMNVWGRAVSCYISSTQLKHNWLLVMEYTQSVTVHYYLYWFCECQSWRTGGRMVSKWMCEGKQSHAYIIRHPISTQWLLVDGIHFTSVQWHYYLIILWVPELENWGTDGSNELYEGDISCLHNQAPNRTQLDFLWMESLTSGTVTLLTCIDFCECQSGELGDGWSPNELYEGEQSNAYIIKHPNETQFDSCDGINWHQVQWHSTCIDSVSARAAQLEDGWSPNELCGGEQSHAT